MHWLSLTIFFYQSLSNKLTVSAMGYFIFTDTELRRNSNVRLHYFSHIVKQQEA